MLAKRERQHVLREIEPAAATGGAFDEALQHFAAHKLRCRRGLRPSLGSERTDERIWTKKSTSAAGRGTARRIYLPRCPRAKELRANCLLRTKRPAALSCARRSSRRARSKRRLRRRTSRGAGARSFRFS